jgi:flavodoxin
VNIAIILHSQTGNTYAVGQRIEERLQSEGHQVSLIRIKTVEQGKKGTGPVELDHIPAVDDYDGLVFGGWIEAFHLCPGMIRYLEQLPVLKDRTVTCFLTEFFPFKWMGGKQGLSKMKGILLSKEATVRASGIINWSRKRVRDQRIEELAETISRVYSQ